MIKNEKEMKVKKVEVYDLGFSKYRLVVYAAHNVIFTYDTFEWGSVEEKIKEYSMKARINHYDQPAFYFYF